MKTRKENRHSKFIGVLTFVSLILIIWEMFIYRKTIISPVIPIAVGVIGGLLCFLFLNTRINYYTESNSPFWAKAFHGTFTFGAIIMFSFMALNYYVPIGHEEHTSLKILKTDNFGGRRGRTGDPYVIVMYNGTRKQLVFPRRATVENHSSVHLEINRGLFGFMTIEKMKLEKIKSDDTWKSAAGDQYDKIKLKAEEYYSEGNVKKAIELYERAVRFNPTDKQAAFRLKELKTHN